MNKNIFRAMLLSLAIGFTSCVNELDSPASSQGGRLQLSLGNISTATTRSTPGELGAPVAEDFHLNLTMKSGYVVYDDVFTEEELSVPIGEYDVTVSYGDNAILGLDNPYYVGTTTATVIANETAEASVNCEVGNALISAKFGANEDEHARFERFYSDYALYAYVGDKGIAIDRNKQAKSIYLRAGSRARLRFWGKLKMENDREVSCDLLAEDFPKVLNAADHAIVTLTLPDPESALGVDISKVEVESITLDETIPLSWLPVPMATAEHKYVGGKLVGTDIVFSNSYPGMKWKAVVTDPNDVEIRSVEGTGELKTPYTSYTALPYLPHGKYKATYYLASADDSFTKTSSREFMIGSPAFSVTVDGYTNYDRYLTGDVDGANNLNGRTIYEPTINWNISETLLTNSNYTYTYSYTYDGNTTNIPAGTNSFTAEAWNNQTPQADKHVLTASATFDGVTVTDRREFVITGLPYSLNLASHDEWTQSGGVDWFDNDVRLGYMSSGSQYIQTNTSICIPPSTYYMADYSVNVRSATVGTTFSIEIGNNVILSIEESGQLFNFGTDHVHTGSTDPFKDDNNYATRIYCKNSYGASQTCSHIYSLTLKYAKP